MCVFMRVKVISVSVSSGLNELRVSPVYSKACTRLLTDCFVTQLKDKIVKPNAAFYLYDAIMRFSSCKI